MRPSVRALLLSFVLVLVWPADAMAVVVWMSTRETYESASIVCWVDSVVYHPPAEPTPRHPTTRAEYSARVTYVWKGEVGRRIRLGVPRFLTAPGEMSASAEEAWLSADQPNLVFASTSSGDSLPHAWVGATVPRDQALARLYDLGREQPPPRALVPDATPPPAVSIRSIARAIVAVDSSSAAAIPATQEVPDSNGILTAALVIRVREVDEWGDRRNAAFALLLLARRGNEVAKRAAKSLFDSPAAEVRRAIVSACKSGELFRREVERARTNDPSSDVRAEAERVVAWWNRAPLKLGSESHHATPRDDR